MPSTTAGVHIAGWSALSPFGVGRQEFVDGLVSGRTGHFVVPDEQVGPPTGGYQLEDFDPVRMLGSKGIRTLDRMTLMSIATSAMLLDEHASTLDEDRESVGLVLGTSTGSIASITHFTRDTFVQDKPYFVNPAAFPNTVMNGAAGHTAIWHRLRGPNSTVSAGHLTGLAALRYATRMIRRGYARTLVVGAVEELSTPVAWAAHRLRTADGARIDDPTRAPMGEGCVTFLLRAADTSGANPPVATVTDFEFAVTAPDEGPRVQGAVLAGVLRDLLGRNGLTPDDLWRVSLAQSGDGALDATEQQALDEAFADAKGPDRITVSRQIGNSFSALGGFQLAALLAAAEHEPAGGPDRPALITALGTDGAVAAALVRV
jgi:3-oxoacyl-[acyl-carrier-protein] synthase II